MKKILFFLLLISAFQIITAQNVGIGTASPNASAQLDITSTNKGILIPRMISTNRILMSNPAEGLLVYDTTQDRLYQFQNGNWQYFLNDSYWRQSTSRNFTYNTTDSIGMGTSSPTQRLDVSGNIRSRNDILADGRVIATGTVTGSGLITQGGLTVSSNGLIGGNFTVNADLSTNSDLIVNNATATLQLRNGSNVNKGFFQLSGDNVRIGTNSGNTTGNFVIRMNGNERITVNPAGDLDMDGKLTRSAVSGSISLLPVCMGLIYPDGSILSGTGNFTVLRAGEGQYIITCSALSTNSIILITTSSGDRIGGQFQFAATSFEVEIRSTSVTGHPLRDDIFSFVAYKPN